jgi:hypothetical protein
MAHIPDDNAQSIAGGHAPCRNSNLHLHRAQEIGTLPVFSAKKPTIRRKFRQGCGRAFYERRGFELTVASSAGWADDCMEVAARHFDV